jgi:hypothetical protein
MKILLFICIGSVKITKKLPNQVDISVLSRQPAAVLVSIHDPESSSSARLNNIIQELSASSSASVSAKPAIFEFKGTVEDMVVVDSEGVVYSKNIEINVPKIYFWGENLILGKRVDQNLIKSALIILDRVKIFGVNIIEAKIFLQRILVINSEPKLVFALDRDLNLQLASLQLILEKAKIEETNMEFIDLRYDKPVVKYSPKKGVK